jgi:hypothetical protein
MKKLHFAAVMLVVIISCNTKQPNKKVVDADSAVLAPAVIDSSNIKKDAHYLWSAELAPKTGVAIKRLRLMAVDSLTQQNIIQILNETYPEIPLRFTKSSNDTLFVKISNSNYLTQQMGSSGPEVYLADVTYNLTEIPGINYVSILFKQGNHASPGIYSRTYFAK